MRGTLRLKAKGVWEIRIYTGRDPVTKRPRQVSKTFHGSKRDAQTEMARLVTDRQEGRMGGTNCTVAELLDAWLEFAQERVTGSSYAVYEDTASRIKTTSLALVRLNNLEAHDIDVAYTELRRRKTSGHVMVQVHRYLGTALRQAERWGWIKGNPQRLVDRPDAPKTAPTELSAVDVRNLVEKAKETDTALASLIMVGGLTGLRRGELVALRWSDIDGAILTVSRSHAVVRGQVVVKPPKWRKAGEVERIELDPICLAALEDAYELQAEKCAELSVEILPNGFVLSKDGTGVEPWRPDRFGREVREIGQKIGLKASPHRLRHFMASEMIAAGVTVAATATRMRHRDTAMTLRRYVHDDRRGAQDAAAALGAALTRDDSP